MSPTHELYFSSKLCGDSNFGCSLQIPTILGVSQVHSDHKLSRAASQRPVLFCQDQRLSEILSMTAVL